MLVCGNEKCSTNRKKQRLLNCKVLKDEKIKRDMDEDMKKYKFFWWFQSWENNRGWWIQRFPDKVPCLRACPKCKSIMKHKKNCPHMKCTSCGTDFCWVCLTPKYFEHDSGNCELADRQILA